MERQMRNVELPKEKNNCYLLAKEKLISKVHRLAYLDLQQS